MRLFFKPHPLICLFNVIQLQAKQKRPVAADVQGCVEAALVVKTVLGT